MKESGVVLLLNVASVRVAGFFSVGMDSEKVEFMVDSVFELLIGKLESVWLEGT